MQTQHAPKNGLVLTEQTESPEFQQLLDKEFKPQVPDITFNDGNFARCERLAKLMASGNATVPAHLRGNIADCFAVVLQTFAWGLNNPFAVAQKTHVINGFLGYEAQLVNAVMQSAGVITGHFFYEYQGEGTDLKCRVGAVIKGQTEITWGEWLSRSQVTTTNSPLWKSNPKQQMGYLQVKNWARAFYPGVLMGVYTEDELFDGVGTQYDQLKQTDLSTPVDEVERIIDAINSATSIDALELLKPTAGLITGEGRARALNAYKAQRKALLTRPSESQDENTSVATDAEQPANVDQSTGEITNEPSEIDDQYVDLRLAISECTSISDIARLLKDMPKEAKDALKPEIAARQAAITGGAK